MSVTLFKNQCWFFGSFYCCHPYLEALMSFPPPPLSFFFNNRKHLFLSPNILHWDTMILSCTYHRVSIRCKNIAEYKIQTQRSRNYIIQSKREDKNRFSYNRGVESLILKIKNKSHKGCPAYIFPVSRCLLSGTFHLIMCLSKSQHTFK